MGSGCNGTNMNGYFGTPIPDKGIMYTGPAIPSLDICTNDRLNEIEAIILQKLIDFSTGKGITIPDIDLTQCEFLNEFILCCAQDKSLKALFDIIFKAICSLKATTDELEDKIDEILNITFDLQCLTVSNPTLQNVLNEIIKQFCLLQDRVEVLEATVIDLQNQINDIVNSLTQTITDIVNSIVDERIGNFILNHIFSCGAFGMEKSGTGSSATITFTGLVPPYCPIPYLGSLSNFDNTGKGLNDKGYCGWYICNGLNNTPDMRGYAFAGATNNVTGGSVDARVSTYPTNMGDKLGEQKHVLTLPELPSVGSSGGGLNLPVVYRDPSGGNSLIQGTTSSLSFTSYRGLNDNSATNFYYSNPGSTPYNGTYEYGLTMGYRPNSFWETKGAVRTRTVGSSASLSGNNEPHENRQPTIHGVWIMRFN